MRFCWGVRLNSVWIALILLCSPVAHGAPLLNRVEYYATGALLDFHVTFYSIDELQNLLSEVEEIEEAVAHNMKFIWGKTRGCDGCTWTLHSNLSRVRQILEEKLCKALGRMGLSDE
jgi:hypothetical protein